MIVMRKDMIDIEPCSFIELLEGFFSLKELQSNEKNNLFLLEDGYVFYLCERED
jgi:hypothetical protein